MYDWANSAFVTTVITLFLGPWLTSLAKEAAATDGSVGFLGFRVVPQAVWPYSVSLSVLTQVFALPLLGAIADYASRKREMLAALAWAGAAATMAMYFLKDDRYALGVALFLFSNFAFGASIVVYNAFLPEIAGPDERDGVSSRGWGLGYLGGGLLLLLNLVMYSNYERIGITEEFAVRFSLFSAGAWWAVFTFIPIIWLRNRAPSKRPPPGVNYVTAGLRQLVHTARDVRRYPQAVIFLVAYLFYNDGIQTVITMASQFGQEELKLGMQALTAAILLAQFVAFFGALAFSALAGWMGNRNAVMLGLLLWCGLLFYAWLGVRGETGFYALAGAAGTVMGGTQALSRSVFSFMIPKGREAEYFSIYEISDKGTSWLGPLLVGLALEWTGNFRIAILSLILFFLIGLAFLARVNVRQAAIEAGNEPPAK
jgi:UMF1 family MFS transporter